MKFDRDINTDNNSESDSDDIDNDNDNENKNINNMNSNKIVENVFEERSEIENSEEFSNYSEGGTLDLESYEENLELDILNNSDVDSYFSDYRKRVDGVLTDLLHDLKTRKSVKKSVKQKFSSKSMKKKILTSIVPKTTEINEKNIEKNEKIDEIDKSSQEKFDNDESKETKNNLNLKILDFENISNSNMIYEKLLKHKSILLLFLFGVIMHHTIIFGLLK